MTNIKELFTTKLIFESHAQEKEEVFREVGEYLRKNKFVKDEFVQEIIKRENDFPTGLDLSPVSLDISNVAIPHTETEFCLTNGIALVKLKYPLKFNNMIDPQQQIDVKYLFIIINKDKDKQTNVLAELMDFFTNVENMKQIDNLDNVEDIYKYVKNNI